MPSAFCARTPPESPIITITPATLVFPPTPPLTPAECTATESKNILQLSEKKPAPPLPLQGYEPNSLHYPLTRHLALMHPNTPREIISFIATRLLSTDRPHGHSGEWTPLYQGHGDLCTAGVGMDVGKGGCKRKEGEGKRKDEELERMYEVAKESFRLLELKSPGVDKL